MKDLIVIVIILVIIGLAALYVYKAKKSGRKCVGCPYADSCNNGCSYCENKNKNT